jgi:hypothetical protein
LAVTDPPKRDELDEGVDPNFEVA